MALSDLELLSLVEQAKEKSRGPQGPAGVGIRSLEQNTDDSITFRFTDGTFKVVSLPKANDGEVGEQGQRGLRGEQGPPGSAGRDGTAGRDGRDGLPGAKGVSLDTAIVNADGQLLFGLSDGKLLRVGNVIGPAGETGGRGPVGLPGSDGQDGSQILTGSQHPNNADGTDGDLYIATGDPVVPLFKKIDGAWTKQCNLKDPQAKAGKGSGGGGSGENIGQTTATLPLTKGASTTTTKRPADVTWPPLWDSGAPVLNSQLFIDEIGRVAAFENQQEYNIWVWKALQLLAQFHSVTNIDGGNAGNIDDNGGSILGILDGDDSPLSNSNGNVIDGGTN